MAVYEDYTDYTIRAWLQEPIHLPEEGRATVAQRIRETPQQRHWWPARPARRSQSMLTAAKFAIASVVLAIVGGFVWAGALVQPSDDPVPAIVASPEPETAETAHPSTEPTSTPEPDSTPAELLPGVDLTTEEVEPGIYKVVSDGIRDLRELGHDLRSGERFPGQDIYAAPDGDVWLLDGQGTGVRLGTAESVGFPEATDIEPSPDGAALARTGFSGIGSGTGIVLSYGVLDDGTWEEHSLRRDTGLIVGDIAVDPEGTVWTARWSDGCAKVAADGTITVKAGSFSFADPDARIDPDAPLADVPCGTYVAPIDPASGQELDGVLAPVLEGGDRYLGVAGLWVDDDGSLWLLDVWNHREKQARNVLSRFDGTTFERVALPDWLIARATMAPDGTLWALLRNWKQPTLARFDGSTWREWDRDDGVLSIDDVYNDQELSFFEIAPDGSIWFNPTAKVRRAQGVARFDGDALTRYLRGLRIYAMDIAPDGAIWVQAGTYSVKNGKERFGPVDVYVITPEAVAAIQQ
jgi:hypothetical protein